MKHDTRHGGPYDRGGADYYYGRGFQPHYFVGGTHTSPKVTSLTTAELEAYRAGFAEAEAMGPQKEWA